MKKIIPLLLISVALFSMSSCEKKGCTDPMAYGYLSKAKKDKGSCKSDIGPVIGTFVVIGSVTCDESENYNFSNVTISIAPSSSAINKVVMNKDGLPITLTVNGSSLTIDNQSASVFIYSGSGRINGNNLTLKLFEYDVQMDETCIYTYSGVKQ